MIMIAAAINGNANELLGAQILLVETTSVKRDPHSEELEGVRENSQEKEKEGS